MREPSCTDRPWSRPPASLGSGRSSGFTPFIAGARLTGAGLCLPPGRSLLSSLPWPRAGASREPVGRQVCLEGTS